MLRTLIGSYLIIGIVAFGMDSPQNLFEQVASEISIDTGDFVYLMDEHSTAVFFDTLEPVTKGEAIGRGGSKIASMLLCSEPNTWVILEPQKNNNAQWLTTMRLEKDVADNVRSVNQNMAQEFKWILITDSTTGRKSLTLAARSFSAMASAQKAFVYDHKNPKKGVFSRFDSRTAFISGVTAENYYCIDFWKKFIDDMVSLAHKGIPVALTSGDSFNCVIMMALENASQNKLASVGMPLLNDDYVFDLWRYKQDPANLTKDFCGKNDAIEKSLIRKVARIKEELADEDEMRQLEDYLVKKYKCSPEDIVLKASDFKFNLKNDYLSVFLFDAATDARANEYVYVNDHNIKAVVRGMVASTVANSFAVFFENYDRAREIPLINEITDAIIKRFNSIN